MTTSKGVKRNSIQQRKNLKKIYRFNEEDREDAILAVNRISKLAMENALNNSARSIVLDLDELESSSNEHSRPSRRYRERAGKKNENTSLCIGSRDKSDVTASSERPLGLFTGIRKRKSKNAQYSSKVSSKNSAENCLQSLPSGVWMCGVSGMRFNSYQEACRHEDNQIKGVVARLGWAQTSLDLKYSASTIEIKRQAQVENKFAFSEPMSFQKEERQNLISTSDQKYSDYTHSDPSHEPIIISATSQPDLLTMSRKTRLIPSPKSSRYPLLSTSEIHEFDRFRQVQEYQELPAGEDDLTPNENNDYLVLADESLVDVCCKAQKLALSQHEREAEFELECYSKDKHYYDILERREIDRQRDGAYSRFRTEGKNFAEKVQNKFVDAYAVMKEGKSEMTTASVDHYKRKLEGDPDVQNVMNNTKKTIYVNVIVKNSIQVVSNELDRLARQRWEERQKKEGSSYDVRNEESRAQFEKFKAAAQGQLVQLAGLALASDFTPRRIAVQLSNDLYR